jgi:hypothetical protein
MKRSVAGAALMLATVGSACDKGTGPEIFDPIATIQSLTVTPDRGRPGTTATVTWVSGEFTYSVRLKQGPCGAVYPDGTADERLCSSMVALGDELPARGSRTLVLNETGYVCVFPARNGGVFTPQGRCVQTTVLP